MRFQGRAESIGPIWAQTQTKSQSQILGRDRPPPAGRPGPRQKNASEDHALLIVPDEFRADYSSIGLLASRARHGFTGIARIRCGQSTETELSSNGKLRLFPVFYGRGAPTPRVQ
jgi:hypothetical protein